MAGAESLISKIVQDSEEKAQEIQVKADEEVAKILEKAKADAKEAARLIENKAKAKAEESHARALTMAGLESRKEILSEKQNQIDKAFMGAVEEIAAFPKGEYQEIIMKMLLEAVESGEETFSVSPGDEKRLDDEFIQKANEELKKQGKKGELKLAVDKDDFGGGFVLKSAQYRINSSFNSIIKMQRDELEPEVAEILFQ